VAEDTEEAEPSRRRKPEVPVLLPPELLESDDEDEDDDAVARAAARAERDAAEARPKKIRFDEVERKLALDARPARDATVGTTVYRVMAAKGDQGLAPKMAKSSAHTKKVLLARGRVVKKQGGFLVGR
jgi:U3 small nucleolar RNA-associated protein 16